jgi:hypothetical protein
MVTEYEDGIEDERPPAVWVPPVVQPPRHVITGGGTSAARYRAHADRRGAIIISAPVVAAAVALAEEIHALPEVVQRGIAESAKFVLSVIAEHSVNVPTENSAARLVVAYAAVSVIFVACEAGRRLGAERSPISPYW